MDKYILKIFPWDNTVLVAANTLEVISLYLHAQDFSLKNDNTALFLLDQNMVNFAKLN